MDELYESLSQKGLKDNDKIEHLIMRDLPLSQIMDIRHEFYDIISKNNPATSFKDISNYSFHIDSNTSAQHSHCPAWSCRLSRVDELARFAAFYTDSVYIQNYFSDYVHPPENEYEEFSCRYALVGDIKILYELEELIRNGIIRFIPPLEPETGLICPDCFHRFVPEYKKIEKYMKRVSKNLTTEYIANVDMTVYLERSFNETRVYRFDISGPEDLFEHGGIYHISQEKGLPKTIQTRLRSFSDTKLKKGYQLNKDEILESKIIDKAFLLLFNDIWNQRCLLSLSDSHLKYLTQRDIEIKFLDDITKNSDINKNNEVLMNNLIYELPIILGIPLDSINEIRNNDYDSFICYRDSINYLIDEYLSKKEILSSENAVEFYNDVVKPQLSKINLKVKSIQTSHLKKAKKDIIISASSLIFGAFCTFFIPPISAYPLALSATEASRAVKSIYDAFQIPEEIHNDNLYFLWKLTR